MKLNTKLLITYIVIGAILILVSGLYIEVTLRESKFQSIEETFVTQLYQLDVTISDFLAGVEYDVENLVANELVQTRDDINFTSFLEADEATFQYQIGSTEQQIIDLFDNYRLTHPYANSVYMGRENGSFVRSHPRNRPTQYDPRLRPWYEIAKDNPDQVMRTAPYRSVTTPDVNIGTVKALSDEQGLIYGVVGIDVTLHNLANYISNTSIGQDGYIVLLDDTGLVLTNSDEETLFKRFDEAGLDQFRVVMENNSGHTTFSQNNPNTMESEAYYVFYYTSPKLGWKVSAVIPASEINSEISQFTSKATWVFALSLLSLSGLIGLSVQFLVVRPVKELQETTDLIVKTGDLDHRINVKTKDEIGQLTASFNNMIESIKTKEDELQDYHGHLEELVEARTAELEETILQAQKLNAQLKQEIFERKQAVSALQANEKNFKALTLLKKAILESPEGIIVFALDKNYRYLDFTLLHKQTMKAIWGVEIEIGQNMLDYIKYEPDREKAKKNFGRALNGEKFVLYEEYGDEKLKRTFYENRYGPILDEDNQIIGLAVYVIDITEQKRTNHKLAESERKYRAIFNATSDALFIHDHSGKILDVNERMCKMFNCSRDEACGMDLESLSQGVPPYSKADAVSKVQRAIEEGQQLFEWRSRRCNGSLFWSEVALQASLIDGEQRVIASVRDITDRKKANEKLNESQQMLQLILDHFPVRVFWKDKNLNFLGNNPLHAQDRGLATPEDIIGKSDYDFFPNEEAILYRTDDAEVIETKTPKLNIEEHQTRHDGSARWLRTSKVPLLDADGEIIGLLGIYEDVTEQKLAYEALKKARSYIANVIDSMPSILIGVDSAGKVTQWNREAHLVTGISSQDAIGQPVEAVFPQLTSEIDQIQKAMQTQKVQSDTKRARYEGDQSRYEDITIYPLVANGIEGAVIRIDDITEQVRIEEMMVQSEKMLSVGGLAAGMAHEINNPLAGMMQTANVMSNRLSQDLPANLKAAAEAGTSMEAIRTFMEARGIPRMLVDINQAGHRVAEIVSNMLSFARRSDAQIAPHNVLELLDKALELAATDYDLKKQYDFKTIEIIKEYENNLPLVPCEGAKIQQVLLNILRNGAQSMQEGTDKASTVTKGHKPRFILRVMHDIKDGMLHVEIEDNGPGMDEVTRKRVFEPFFTTKPVGEGTGLGLSVSYFIITENHGGTLDVISEPGKGATFIIRLPLERKDV